MTNLELQKARTGLLVVDPYNDFISAGGKYWDRVKTVADENDCVANMHRVLESARRAGLRVFYALHHRYRPGDYESWKFMAPIQRAAWQGKAFEDGTWGGTIREEFTPVAGDVVAQEHWCSSGFYNTDLDLQLKRHEVRGLLVVGLRASTCIDSTVRSAAELGYDVTLIRDAIASFSPEEMRVTLDITLPNYAGAIVGTAEITSALAKAT